MRPETTSCLLTPFLVMVRSRQKTCWMPCQSAARSSFNSELVVLSFHQASVSFLAQWRATPLGAIGLWVLEEQGDLLASFALVVFGNHHIFAPTLIHVATPFALGMQRIAGEQAVLELDLLEQMGGEADLVVLVVDAALGPAPFPPSHHR